MSVVNTKFSFPPHPAPFRTIDTLLTDKLKLNVSEKLLVGVEVELLEAPQR